MLGFENTEWNFWAAVQLKRRPNDKNAFDAAMSIYGKGYGAALARGKNHESARWCGKLAFMRSYMAS